MINVLARIILKKQIIELSRVRLLHEDDMNNSRLQDKFWK